MSIKLEQQILQIHPFEYKVEKDHCLLLVKESKKRYKLPQHYSHILECLTKTNTLRDLVLKMYESKYPVRYKSLIAAIRKFAQIGMISNTETFLEDLFQLEGSQKWSQPILSKGFFSIPLMDLKTLIPSSGLGVQIFSFLIIALGINSALLYPNVTDFTFSDPNLFRTGILFWILNSALFFTLGFVEIVSAIFFRGVIPSTNVEFSILGLRLNIDRSIYFDHKHEGTASLFLFARPYLYLFMTVTLFEYVDFEDNTFLILQSFFLLTLLAEISPISKTSIGEAWKLLYQSGFRKKYLSRSFELINLTYTFLWFAFTCFVLGLFWRAHPLRHEIHSIDSVNLVGALVISLLSTLLTIGLFIDIWGAMRRLLGSFQVESLFFAKRNQDTLNPDNLKNAQDLEETFQQFSLLRSIPEETRQTMIKSAAVVSAKKGQRVCTEGQTDRRMFGVLSGRLGVYKRTMNGNQFLVDLTPGALFGEVSFFAGAKRTASVYALEDTDLLRLKYVAGEGEIEITGDQLVALQDRIWLSQTLVRSSLFQGLPLECIDQVIALGNVAETIPNQTLTKEGEEGDSFYVIVQGEAKVSKKGKFLRSIKRGDVFGELALLKNIKRTATVASSTDMILLVIKAKEFRALLASNWSLAIAVENLSAYYLWE